MSDRDPQPPSSDDDQPQSGPPPAEPPGTGPAAPQPLGPPPPVPGGQQPGSPWVPQPGQGWGPQPGQWGTQPGQSGAQPGQWGAQPGQWGAQPGQWGAQPGQWGAQPGQPWGAQPGQPFGPPVQAPRSNTGAIVAASLVGVGIVPVAVLGAAAGWGAGQLVEVTSGELSWWTWPLIALLIGALVGGPAALLAFLPRSPAVRSAGRAWLLAAGAAAGLTLLRMVPPVHHELYLALLTLVAGGGAWLLRRRRAAPRATGAAPWLAVAAGLAVLLPWLWVGALGGLLETVLAGTAAAAVGWLAGAVLDGRFWLTYGPGRVRLVLLGGTVAGLVLLLLAVGTGHAGPHLAELLVLPPLGYALATLYAIGEFSEPAPRGSAEYVELADAPAPGAPVGLLVGIAAFGPLAFTDPEEVTLLLATGRDIPAWTGIAAALSWAVALLIGLVYALSFRRVMPHRWVGAGAAAVLLVAAVAVHAGPGQPGLYGDRLFVVLKQQADLTGVSGTGPAAREARVAEVYRRLVATANSSQAELRRSLDRWNLTYTPYYLVNAIEVDGGPGVRAWLAARDDVDRVLVGQRLRPLVEPPGGTMSGDVAAPTAPGWNLTSIGADRVRSQLGVDGRGITVGSSDSGVDGSHPALAATFRGGDDSWYDPWDGTRTPRDDGGHGTHTLASAVGARNVGVAPGATWTGCVNLDRNLGNPARYLDCLQFMLAPFPPGGDPFTDGRPARAPQVLTNSWGCPDIEGCDTGALRAATAAFAAAGTFFVAAAGNSGPACGTVQDPPAPYADVLTVGAVNERGTIADFSSRGPTPGGAAKPDVVAPGAEVLSALPGGGYGTLSGTSMAAPHVAGVVALMWSAAPALVADLPRTGRILRETAAPVADAGSACGGAGNVTGAGRVDAYAAVRAAQAIR